ncbi:MAG: hypothetical protein ACI4AM_02310, partial [Muribaculaceae bacterium]
VPAESVKLLIIGWRLMMGRKFETKLVKISHLAKYFPIKIHLRGKIYHPRPEKPLPTKPTPGPETVSKVCTACKGFTGEQEI